MPALHIIKNNADGHDAHEEHARPIELLERGLIHIRPEAPEESPAGIDEGDEVDGGAGAAEGPAGVG